MTGATVPVWGRAVRVLHWGLAGTVVAAWLTGDAESLAHEVLGYAALAVVALRCAWGLFGGGFVRFAGFVRGPRATAAYARAALAGRAPRHLGHNPLGGWMIVALLATVAALSITGALYATDWLWGTGWLAALHLGLGWLIVALVALHVAGAVVTGRLHRENLVAAMFTGAKRAPGPGDET